MTRMLLNSVVLCLLTITVFAQNKIDIKEHIYFFDKSYPSQVGKNISVQNATIKLKDYISDTSYMNKFLSKVPIRSKTEIQLAVSNDKTSFFKPDSRIKFFSEDEVFEKQKNFGYAVPNGADESFIQQEEQKAILERKNSLADNEQVIYLFSNLYFDKTKTYLILFILTSTVGNENTRLILYKKNKNQWNQLEVN